MEFRFLNMNRKRKTLLVACWAFAITANAQQSNRLTMGEAVNIAVENNANIKLSELDRKISNANYHQTDAIFLPQVSVSYNAMVTNNPLNAFGFLLQQSRVTAQDFDPSRLNHPGASRNYNAGVEVKMPLLNVDRIFARKGAKLQEEVYKNKEQYTKDYIRFEVQKAYTQLQFAYQARDILTHTLEDVRRIYQSVKNFYDQGLVQKSDVLNAQVQVNTVESALAKAESSVINASDGLKLLMGGSSSETNVYIPDSLIQKTPTISAPAFSETRSDVVAMQKALEASKMMVKSSYTTFLPTINAFGTYQFNDTQIFKFKEDSYLAGISLSWNLFSGNRNRSKLRSALMQRDKMQKELELHIDKSRIEVDKTTRNLLDLQFEIRKQEASVEQATEALRILTDRHREGLASTTDLLLSQAQLSQQRLTQAQAVMAYNIAGYYQELLTTNK